MIGNDIKARGKVADQKKAEGRKSPPPENGMISELNLLTNDSVGSDIRRVA